LEDKLCKEGTKDKIVEYFVDLFQVGIQQVQLCKKGFCFEFEEKGVKENTPLSFLTLWGRALQVCIEKMQGVCY